MGNWVNFGQSVTKSRFFFYVGETEAPTGDVAAFRDPAAVPMLQGIASRLTARGYDVTPPMPGKACHAACSVKFPHVLVSLVLLVFRCNECVNYELLTWPRQNVVQRWSGHRLASPEDCREWGEVCATVDDVLRDDEHLNSVRSLTFAEAEAVRRGSDTTSPYHGLTDIE
jgi:hypothetical protein